MVCSSAGGMHSAGGEKKGGRVGRMEGNCCFESEKGKGGREDMGNQRVERNQTISFPSVNSTLGLVISYVSFAIRRKVSGGK